MVERRYVFIGGFFTAGRAAEIVARSTGPVQHAADALQKGLLQGLASAAPHRAPVALNLPFIGSWPHGFSRLWYAAARDEREAGLPVIERSFLNVRMLRALWRLLATLRGLGDRRIRGPKTIIVYSANTPFVAAACIYKLLRPHTRICLILPDLLEFMGEGNWRYRLLKSVEGWLFDRLRPCIDHYVLLSRFMAERLHLPAGSYVVVEGMLTTGSLAEDAPLPARLTPGARSFLYTGVIARRYGIGDLLEAFAGLTDPDLELWICGEGDGQALVEAAARRDPRIRYAGQVTRDIAVAMQRRATVLVNPRRPEGVFTRYSFPSKTIEYLAAGRPVIMHALPGVPEDYRPHLVMPDTPDAAGLARAMQRIIDLPEAERIAMGARGCAFVTARKRPEDQCRRIVELIG